MNIKGLQKTTLLDYPGKVACTVFTGGCNLRCPFCHNASIAVRPDGVSGISEEELFRYLERRRGILDGVCITGGEPLLQSDIIPFIGKIHSLGFSVKLDTNGTMPQKLGEIISMGIADYVAMDIKNTFSKYPLSAGADIDCGLIAESIALIMNGGTEYEFRTTVVKELHTEEDISKIAEYISGAENYYLQVFKDSGDLIGTGFGAHDADTMNKMLASASRFVKHCEIRGM